jgi:CDP-glucose 4,6-dehydratase
MNVLVTGANGAIGANLAEHFIEKSQTVISIEHDIKPMGSAKSLGIFDEITWVRGDVTDENLVKRIVAEYDVQEIYHLAALPIVQTGLRVYVPVYHTNIFGTLALLEAIRDQKNAG